MTPARNVLTSESEQDNAPQDNTVQNQAAQSEVAQSEAARQLAVLKTIAEESADCIKLLDLDARLLSMNAGGMLSLEIDDFTVCRNLLWPDFWHGEDRVKVEAALDRARAGQRSVFEGQSATFKGTPRWWEVRLAPVLGSGGAVEQLIAVSRDVTERKRAEQALAEMNAGLEAQVAARTLQTESQARAQDAFVAFTEAVGSETDDLALALQAIEVLLLHFPEDSAGFYFRTSSEVRGPGSARSGETSGDVWQVQAGSGTFPGGFRPPETLAADHPLIAPVLQTGQPVFIGDWSATPGRLNTEQNFGAVASVPLVIAGEVRGMLIFGLRHTISWSERDQALLRAVSRGLTLALERSERVQQVEETARAQDAFVALTEAVGTQTDVLALAQQAIEVLQAHLPGADASFQVLEDGLWKAKAWNHDLPESVAQLIRAGVPGTHPVIAQMMLSRQPVFIDRWLTLPGQPVASPEHTVSPEHSRAVAAYPLTLHGETAWMLSVGLSQTRTWQKRDQALVRAVGRALNLALERADSLGQLGERSRELERLNSDLGREQAFLSTVLENLSEGVVACDEHGRLTLFNTATRTFHGLDASPLPPEEWAGHYDLYEADGVTPLATGQVPLYRAWRGERLRDVEFVIRPKGGQTGEGEAQGAERTQPRTLLASGQPMFTPGGQPLGAVVTMRDVTARRTAEQRLQVTVQQLQRSNAELSAANEELEAFAYSASHDLRTPVRHVQSFSELARKALSGAPNEGAERYLGHVEQAAQRMSLLIDALLSLSRSSRQDLTPAPVDLELLLRRARKDMQGELVGREVQWRTRALPVVVGDQALLQQVMNNLLANAVKFSRTREQALIEVWCEEDAAAWTVYVRDNGAGFDPKYRERLFGVFQRLHTEREFEGTGVGLATVRRIVLRHGGNVSASSVPGEGATFGFTLPKQR